VRPLRLVAFWCLCACAEGLDDPAPPVLDDPLPSAGGGGAGGAAIEPEGCPTPDAPVDPLEDCTAQAGLIYLASTERSLYSFDPTIPGIDAYQLVGRVGCSNVGLAPPQSMAVDRFGDAWMFFSEGGEMYRVSTLDASCVLTSYVDPIGYGTLVRGMGFTSRAGGEDLYMVIPEKQLGLSRILLPCMKVKSSGSLIEKAELSGGPDGRLFHFTGNPNAVLSEVDLGTTSLQPIRTFPELDGSSILAFSRFAGRFYFYTSTGWDIGSRTTEYDPETGMVTVRDADLGFTVIGAGQSICVPPPTPR
jgi:hypothetical protein